MYFIYLIMFILPLVATAASVISNQVEKNTYHPKPSSWMMTPLAEKDWHHARTISDSASWVVTQSFYEVTGMFCSYQASMQVSYLTDYCIQTGPSNFSTYTCTYGTNSSY